MKLNTSYISKHFINNHKKGEVYLDNPYVLILDGKLENIKPLQEILEYVAINNKSILIITEHVHENILRPLESNVLSGNIQLAIMKSPGFSSHRQNLLEDISNFTNARLFKGFDRKVSLEDLGMLKSANLGLNHSILVKNDNIDVSDKINTLRSLLEEDKDNELLQQRIENLEGKISIIKVGGTSELEMKERFDRYDDAVRAVQCALEEGIVQGAGRALFHSIDNIEENSEIIGEICDAVCEPMNILKNDLLLEKDFFENNIIDPLKVIRTSLENAVSVAKTVLSTEAIVLNESEWNG